MRSSNFLRQAKRRQNRNLQRRSEAFYSPQDQIVGKETLAEILDVSITTIERWIREGMPVQQRGDQLHDWIFQLEEVSHWRKEKGLE